MQEEMGCVLQRGIGSRWTVDEAFWRAAWQRHAELEQPRHDGGGDIVKGTFPELTNTAEKGLLPMFTREPGFVNYGLVDAGNNKLVSISIWETREAAQKSATMAANWVKENVSDRINLVTSYVGDLALYHGTPVAA